MWWDRWDLWVWAMGVCPRTACGATARVRMYDFASLFKAFKFSLTLRNASKSPCLHGGGGAWNFEIWWSESDYLTLRNIMHFSAQRIRMDKALSCTPQTNRVFICWECAALYTRCRVVPSPLTPLLSSAAPRPLRRCAVQPYVRTSAYNRLCFADCRHCRSTK